MTQDMSKDNKKQHSSQCEVRNLRTVSPSASNSLFPSCKQRAFRLLAVTFLRGNSHFTRSKLRLYSGESHSPLASFCRYAVVVLLMMVGGITGAWAQTDYSGFFYIANETDHGKDIANRYYLVPAKNPQQPHYADAYFNSQYCNVNGKGDYSGDNYGDSEKPFITTYKTNRDKSSMWQIKSSTISGYYYIIHCVTGKYLVYEPPYKEKDNRKSFHLEDVAETPTDDKYLFSISGSLSGPINISSKKKSGWYFNPAANNINQFYGTDAADNGDYWAGGIVGVYNNTGGNSQWYFEDVPPYFVYTSENKIKIIYPDDAATIYYTTDGKDPAISETKKEYKGEPFGPDDGQVIIRAIAKTDSHQSAEGSSILPCSSSPYLMQNVECTDFYMIPGDLSNNETVVHTTSLGRPTMQWYFKPAGMDNDYPYQYFYIYNKGYEGTDENYLFCNSDGNVRMKTVSDFEASKTGDAFDSYGDDYKFRILADASTGYRIVPKNRQTHWLYKNGNNAGDAISTSNSSTSTQCRWNLIPLSKKPAFTPPFTVSGENNTYYKIKNASNTTYFIIPGTTNEYATTSDAAESDNMKWYFREAGSDGWNTYYYIVNAATNEYLYYRHDNLTTTANKDNAFTTKGYSSGGSDEDRYQFVVANTATSTSEHYYYIVPKPLKYLSNNQYMLVWRDSTNPLKVSHARNDSQRKWIFDSTTFTCEMPVITNDDIDGTITITCTTPGAKIYYTTSTTGVGDCADPTSASTLYSGTFLQGDITYIKAIAMRSETDASSVTGKSFAAFKCAKPVIQMGIGGIVITCATAGATIYYTLDQEIYETDPLNTTGIQQYMGTPITYDGGNPPVVRAFAIKGESISTMSLVAEYNDVPQIITKTSEITNLSGNYIFGEGFTDDLSEAIQGTFTGKIDGQFIALSLGHPLFASTENAVIKNVMLKDVKISGSGSVGAIVGEAGGYTRIYNCGILPTNNKYESDASYVKSSDGYCGGLVGWLKDDSRVVNCFSYANITGGTDVAGIVGHNETASNTTESDGKYANLRTAVVNCMFYGDITGGTNVYPVYGGANMLNTGDNGINTYDFYRAEANITVAGGKFNGSWPASEENLTRFEYYRYLLNSNRELCGWWVKSDVAPNTMSTTDVQAIEKDASLMAKWVLDPSIAPYPILKSAGKYSSVINPDPEKRIDPGTKQWVDRVVSSNTIQTDAAPDTEGQTLGTVNVTIKAGSHHILLISRQWTSTTSISAMARFSCLIIMRYSAIPMGLHGVRNMATTTPAWW